MKKLIIYLLSIFITNSAYSDITRKMDCTVKETNNITIDKGFHRIWKYIGIGSLKTDEQFKILYSIKTNQISIELENIYNRYKDIDNLFFYRNNFLNISKVMLNHQLNPISHSRMIVNADLTMVKSTEHSRIRN